MDIPKDQTPEAVASVFQIFLGYFAAYGWHLLFFLVVANLVYSHFRPKIQKWLDERSDQQLAAEYQQNPDRLIAMQESLAQSRQRMQEENDRFAREKAEQLKQREEEKRQEKIKKWECKQTGSSFSEANRLAEGSSSVKKEQKLKTKSSDTSFRQQDHNPLMGYGSGSSYRPPRRGGSAGG